MRKTYSAKTLLLLGSLAAATAARAQDAPRVQNKVLGANGQPELVRFAAGKAAYRGTADGEQLLRQQLALGTDDKMLPTRAETDELGFFHQKYAQYYKGIRVEHADYTVHAKGGAVESISGEYEDVKGLSTAPALNAEAALRRALIFVGARKYMWQDAVEEAGLKQQENNPGASYYPAGELVVVRDHTAGDAGPLVLAWKFNVYAHSP